MRRIQDWLEYVQEQRRLLEQAEEIVKAGRTRPRPKREVSERGRAASGAPQGGPPPVPVEIDEKATGGKVRPIEARQARFKDEMAAAPEPPDNDNFKQEDMARLQQVLAAAQAVLQEQLPLPEMPDGSMARRRVDRRKWQSRRELIERLLDPELNLGEVAELLNVCPATVRRYANRGVLRCQRSAGNHRRFHLSQVLAFLSRLEADGQS